MLCHIYVDEINTNINSDNIIACLYCLLCIDKNRPILSVEGKQLKMYQFAISMRPASMPVDALKNIKISKISRFFQNIMLFLIYIT